MLLFHILVPLLMGIVAEEQYSLRSDSHRRNFRASPLDPGPIYVSRGKLIFPSNNEDQNTSSTNPLPESYIPYQTKEGRALQEHNGFNNGQQGLLQFDRFEQQQRQEMRALESNQGFAGAVASPFQSAPFPGHGALSPQPQHYQFPIDNALASASRVARTGYGYGYGGGQNCQVISSFHPGCCNLGYVKCCQSHNHHPPPHHHPHPPQHGWRPPPPPPPVKPPIYYPIKPHPPILPPPRPPHHGWGHQNKPGSCFYKSPFSFLKNIFSKDHHHHQKGWGWGYPPSQHSGYHFFRRNDIIGINSKDKKRRKREAVDPIGLNGPGDWSQGRGEFGLGGIRSGWQVVGEQQCTSDLQCPGGNKCCNGFCTTPNLTLEQ